MTDHERSDLPARIADLLEEIARRVRALTVDRISNAVVWSSVGLVLATIGFLVVFWLLVGVYRALGELIGTEVAYAVTGGILILVGALLWRKRHTKEREPQE